VRRRERLRRPADPRRRGPLHRVGPRPRAARPDLAPGTVLVPGRPPVLHGGRRLHRPVDGALARLDGPRRHAGHRVRHRVHGPARHPGADARPAADDPVPGQAGPSGRRRGAARELRHLRRLHRRRRGAARHRAERAVRMGPRRRGGRRRAARGRAGGRRPRRTAPRLPDPALGVAPVLRGPEHRDRAGAPGAGRRAAGRGRLPAPRLRGAVRGRRGVQPVVRALRLRRLALPAAIVGRSRDRRLGRPGCRGLGGLADRRRRLARDVLRRRGRARRDPRRGRLRRRRPRHHDRRAVRARPRRRDGSQRLQRDAHDRDGGRLRARTVPSPAGRHARASSSPSRSGGPPWPWVSPPTPWRPSSWP
jgi:hypothetical protein